VKRTTILRTTGIVILTAAAITAIGALVVRDQIERHQRDLFSPRPLKRLAALGYIAGLAATVELARTLRDFISWEERPMLRRRANVILDRMEADLVRAANGVAGAPATPARMSRGVADQRAATARATTNAVHPGIAG
jgi:hypothetical protein